MDTNIRQTERSSAPSIVKILILFRIVINLRIAKHPCFPDSIQSNWKNYFSFQEFLSNSNSTRLRQASRHAVTLKATKTCFVFFHPKNIFLKKKLFLFVIYLDYTIPTYECSLACSTYLSFVHLLLRGDRVVALSLSLLLACTLPFKRLLLRHRLSSSFDGFKIEGGVEQTFYLLPACPPT